MAISGTDSTIDSSLRDNLSNSMSSDAYISAVGKDLKDPSSYAGIKPGFLTNLNTALDEYIKALDDKLNELETSPNIKQAFRGYSTETAVKNLIIAVKKEAQRYTSNLKEAEKAIVRQVNSLYASQSISVGQSMGADTSKLGGGQ